MALILRVLILSAIVSLSVALEITWTRYKESRSITVNETSFSVADKSPPYRTLWNGISVLGEYVRSYGDLGVWCFNITYMDKHQIGLIKRAYHRANGDDSCGPGCRLSEPERYVFEGDVMKLSLGGRENFISYSRNGYFVFMLDENKYSVSGPSLPEDMERIFVDDDMVGIVEKDGNTIMKPLVALRNRFDHAELFREVRRSIEPLENCRRIVASLDHRLAEFGENFIDKVRVEFNEINFN